MARLPSEVWMVQQINGTVVVFHEYTNEEIVRFDPSNADQCAKAQGTINDSKLSVEDKAFAHFWSGYFYGHAS